MRRRQHSSERVATTHETGGASPRLGARRLAYTLKRFSRELAAIAVLTAMTVAAVAWSAPTQAQSSAAWAVTADVTEINEGGTITLILRGDTSIRRTTVRLSITGDDGHFLYRAYYRRDVDPNTPGVQQDINTRWGRARVKIHTQDDAFIDVNRDLTFSVISAGQGRVNPAAGTVTVSVSDNDAETGTRAGLTPITPTEITEGDWIRFWIEPTGNARNIPATLTVTGAVDGEDLSFRYPDSSNDPGHQQQLTLSRSRWTWSLRTYNDREARGTRTLTFTLTSDEPNLLDPATSTRTVTLLDDDASQPVSFELISGSVAQEGDTIRFQLGTQSQPVPGSMTLEITGSTALLAPSVLANDSDSNPANGVRYNIATTHDRQSLDFPLVNDDISNGWTTPPQLTFRLIGTDGVNVPAPGHSTATITIRDDDYPRGVFLYVTGTDEDDSAEVDEGQTIALTMAATNFATSLSATLNITGDTSFLARSVLDQDTDRDSENGIQIGVTLSNQEQSLTFATVADGLVNSEGEPEGELHFVLSGEATHPYWSGGRLTNVHVVNDGGVDITLTNTDTPAAGS